MIHKHGASPRKRPAAKLSETQTGAGPQSCHHHNFFHNFRFPARHTISSTPYQPVTSHHSLMSEYSHQVSLAGQIRMARECGNHERDAKWGRGGGVQDACARLFHTCAVLPRPISSPSMQFWPFRTCCTIHLNDVSW